MTEMTVDTSHGIITGIDCYAANQREIDIILEHLKEQPCEYQEIGLDGGYGSSTQRVGVIRKQWLYSHTGISKNAMKKGFRYEDEKDRFVCNLGEYLEFHKLVYKKQHKIIPPIQAF